MNQKWICTMVILVGLLFAVMTEGVFGKEKVFPTKAVELICHMGAGGSVSMGGRILAGTLSEYLGTPVVVVNKVGGGGGPSQLNTFPRLSQMAIPYSLLPLHATRFYPPFDR